MKYGFIGAGNIAEAAIAGMLAKGVAAACDIAIVEQYPSRLEYMCKKYQIASCGDAETLAVYAETVFIAVKPHQLAGVLAGLREALAKTMPLVVYIAAGKSIAFAEEALDGVKVPLVRVMPNVNAAVGESVTWFCGNAHVTEAHKAVVRHCFDAMGMTFEIDETYSSVYSAIGASAPAFAYMFIESVAKAAHKAGLDKKKALEVAAQMTLGSAKMVLESGEHPSVLVDKVCSPGGMTIEGVCSLEADSFSTAVIKAVDAAITKDKKL